MNGRQVDALLVRSLLQFAVVLAVAGSVLAGAGVALAGVPTAGGVLLGTADNFAVLGGQGVTNTGPTTVNGDLGTWPNPAVTGAGLTVNGTIHAGDAVAQQAQADLTVAYVDAAGRTPTQTDNPELGGRILPAGVYAHAATQTRELTGTLTLDGQNNPDAVFVFQTASTLVTASNSTVNLINGANACNVYWQVGSSATLGTNSTFVGTILALTSVTVTTGVTIDGRALARNGSVTLDSDTITRSTCTPPTATETTLTASPNASTTGEPVTLTAAVADRGGGTPTGTVTFLDNGSPIGSSPLDDGAATLTTTSLTTGTHQLTGVYLGAPGLTSSTSNELTFVVIAPPQTPPTNPATPPATTAGTPSPGGPATSTGATPSTPRTLPVTGIPGADQGGAIALALVAAGGTLATAASMHGRRRDRST